MPCFHRSGRRQEASGEGSPDPAYNAISGGAHGVDMGRNIFQSAHSLEMAAAIGKIVHEGFTDKEAYEFFEDAIH